MEKFKFVFFLLPFCCVILVSLVLFYIGIFPACERLWFLVFRSVILLQEHGRPRYRCEEDNIKTVLEGIGFEDVE